MPTTFTVRQIAEAALRRVGEFAPPDTDADPDKLSVALDTLDRMLAHYCATHQFQWMIPTPVSIAIPASTNPLDIVSIATTAQIPTGDFLAIDQIVLVQTSNGREHPLRRVSRREYAEEIEQKSAGGFPRVIYIDRSEPNPKVYLYPVLALTGYQLKFTYFQYSPAVVNQPNAAHKMVPSWQRWMDFQLAFDCGSGPIVLCQRKDLDLWQATANDALDRLLAIQNRETKRPKRVANWDF